MRCEFSSPCFTQDQDIGGIGVRLSFYIQSFVLVFLIACSFKDASGSLWTLIATSVGLQIAALVQYGDCSLTLFQAVQVNNLVWMANFCIVIGLASYSRGRRILEHDFVVQIGAMIEMYLSIVLTFLLWTAAPHFNNDPCTSQTPFIFFWRSFAAVRTGRQINLVFVSLVTMGYTYVTYVELRARWEARDKCDGVRSRSPPLQHVTMGSEPSETEDEQTGGKMARRKRKGRKRSPQWSNLPPILFSIVFFETAVTAYFVAMNEILVSKSARSGERQSPWSFGQILALIVIFPSIVTLWQSVVERPWMKIPAMAKQLTNEQIMQQEEEV